MVGAGGVTGVIRGKLYVVTRCFSEFYPPDVCMQGRPNVEDLTGPRFFRYNPVTDRWVTLPPPFPAATSENIAGHALAGGVINGKFYVMGAYENGKGGLSVYDPATNQWTVKTPLGVGRPGAATAVLGNKLYVMGGLRSVELLDVTIVYDPLTDAWTRRASLPSPRAGIAANTVWLNGKPRIEVVGGAAPANNVQYVP